MAEGKSRFKQIIEIIGGNAAINTNKKLSRSINGIARASRRMRSALASSGRLFGAQALGLYTVGIAVRKTIRSYSEYTEAVANLRTTLSANMQNFRLGTRITSAYAETISRELGYSVIEANNAMNTMMQTGVGVHKGMRMYRTAMQIARIANIDTSRGVQFLVDSTNMFRSEMADTGETVQEFSRRMASQLSVAANSAATNIGDLQVAFRYAGGELSGLGYNSREVVSALASLSAGGIRGSSAGTRLRGAIAALNNPSRRTIEVFKQFGVQEDEIKNTFYNLETGAMRPLSEGMTRMGALFGRMNSQMGRNQALMRLYGRRSMIAGMALSDMGEIANRFHTVFRRLGDDDVLSGAVIDRQEEERMRSFGMQMEQLKNAAQELAIGFGEIAFKGLETTERPFGTYARNVVSAMRLSGNLSNLTHDQRREWEGLSADERQAGTELREFLSDLVQAIKIISKATITVGRFLNENREIIPLIAGLALTFHPVTLGILKFGAAWASAGSLAGAGGAAISGASVMMVAGTLAVVYATGLLSKALSDVILKTMGLDNGYKELEGTVMGATAKFAEAIPIIGPLVAQILRLGAGIEKIFQLNDQRSNRVGTARTRAFQSAADVMRNREERERSRGREMTDNQRRQFASMQYQSTISVLTAQFARREQIQRRQTGGRAGVTSEEIVGQLRRAGLQGEELQVTAATIFNNLQRDLSRYTATATELGLPLSVSARETQQLVTRLNDFKSAMNAVASASVAASAQMRSQATTTNTASGDFEGLSSSRGGGGGTISPIQTVQDAYVRSGGVISVSSGDIVVSRSHLADALAGSRGSMVPAITGGGGGDNTVQPPGGGGGGGGSFQVDAPIVLELDGNVLARAVGKVHLRHLERSGTTIQPGQRRTMAESGFGESRR